MCMTNKTNEMMTFTNDLYGSVRSVQIDNVVWFFGKDVVECLGYDLKTNSYSLFIQRHCEEEDCLLVDSKTQLQNIIEFDYKQLGQRGGYLINEYAILDLVMGSPLPQAKAFKRWITHEVIPSVLQHGAYIDTSRADALPYVEEKLAEMEKIHEIDERYISSLRQRIQQAVKDRNSAWQVQADRREIIDEMQRLINMLIDGQELTREQLKQLAKIDALRELTGNLWITK